jgi:hypothetical protein
MRATRRRSREFDPLASSEAVRSICVLLRERMPDTIPSSEKQLSRFLFAVRHIERRPATDTKRGRPSRWPREKLVEAAGQLRTILERETSGRVSLSSFIGQYLPILEFPSDVADALSKGEINLHEATQLSRLTPERLDCTQATAKSSREEVLKAHLLVHGSQNRLRVRVKEILGEVVTVSSEQMTSVVQKVDELLEIDPSDKRHFFYEEMKRLFYAMREIRPEDIDDESLDQFMAAADQLSNAIHVIELRRRRQQQKPSKLIT